MALSVQLVPDAHTQKDGSRYVVEVYSDAQGECARQTYLLAPGGDATAIANSRISAVLSGLIERELRQAIRENTVPSFRFATPQQFANFIKAEYPELTGEQQAEFSWWLNNRLVAGDVTDAQMMNLFELTQGQWNTRRSRIEALAVQYEAVKNASP